MVLFDIFLNSNVAVFFLQIPCIYLVIKTWADSEIYQIPKIELSSWEFYSSRVWYHQGFHGSHVTLINDLTLLDVAASPFDSRSDHQLQWDSGLGLSEPLQKWHMWITCEVPKTQVIFHMWNTRALLRCFTCEISHVIFHMCFTREISHGIFHMWNFTCEISYVKFHMWNFPCEISYVNCHMWYFTCEQFYMIKLCNFICQSSHVKINMWYSPCEFSKVKFLMVGHILYGISTMTFYAVIHVAFHI